MLPLKVDCYIRPSAAAATQPDLVRGLPLPASLVTCPTLSRKCYKPYIYIYIFFCLIIVSLYNACSCSFTL